MCAKNAAGIFRLEVQDLAENAEAFFIESV